MATIKTKRETDRSQAVKSVKIVKYLTVSDLLQLADQIHLERNDLVRIMKSMLPVADIRRCCYILTDIGKLDCLFPVIKNVAAMDPQRTETYSDVII